MASAYIAERGEDILEDRTYDELVGSFYGLFECNEDHFAFE